MMMKVEQLEKGYIVQRDVSGLTGHPIIPANTELTEEHIEVLKAFLIEEIDVESQLTKGVQKKKGTREKSMERSKIKMSEAINRTFMDEYQNAVRQFKKQFQTWQSGLPIHISNVRTILTPLFEIALKNKDWIHFIHQLSQPEEYFYHHPVAVSIISGWLANKMGYDHGKSLQIAFAGLLADCGMAKINKNLFMIARTLTDSEWREIKKHPLYSYQMVKDISVLKSETKLAIAQHHERLDGTGYPGGKTIKNLLIESQIIAIADIYHAMTTERLFKNSRSPFKTLQMMEIDQFGKLHISILKEFISAIATLPIGTTVSLSNGQKAEIIFHKPHAKTRPLIKIKGSGEIIDLEKNRNLYIDFVVNG
ncbi:HD domain-containing protein [Lederbergia sp. NSJ-179]|uniref:HD-GYP domain-containing protein n=1 Tax=Lederbergia sp. NSJ-179 TaxID=2931402 RepID=UPI001FD5ECE4|nr:HD domain-containing phosphohydrolase [Lederbergia sp. NSJ-179]MCJ7843492.1 HD domain-containing protein [Lederbergia sp. NSJ-179]